MMCCKEGLHLLFLALKTEKRGHWPRDVGPPPGAAKDKEANSPREPAARSVAMLTTGV